MDYPRFELVTKYKDNKELLPTRATAASAGYDFFVAEDTVVPSYSTLFNDPTEFGGLTFVKHLHHETLDSAADFTKKYKCRPTLVPTGVKAYMPKNVWLQVAMRSSCAIKDWLVMPNGIGVVDSDYYNNPDNEGHIFVPLINLFPYDIQLNKGDRIGQGIFVPYFLTEGDNTTTIREGGFGSTGT